MRSIIDYLKEIISAVWSLMKGMKVTGSYFFRPGTIVTQKYPNNRKDLVMFDRFKGEVVMPHNEKNEHKCTGCGICELNCPNGTIEIISKTIITEEGKKKKSYRQAYLQAGHVHLLRIVRKNMSFQCPCIFPEIRTCGL